MQDVQTHFLYPSTLFASPEPYLISTVLGSCVAVCLYDPVLRLGGINHYMLPFWNGQGLASPKFGNIAITKLLEKMYSFGCNIYNLEAKVFGGANIFESKLEQFQIGERNTAIAEQLLKEHKIAISGSSTGGNLGRRIEFHSHSGEVYQRMIMKGGEATMRLRPLKPDKA